MKSLAILSLVLFSFSLLANTPREIPPQSKACKVLAAEISKSGKLTTDEDFQRIGTRLPKDVYARARKFMDNGEKINAVREVRACLKTGLMESKRIVELLP
ncbi:MAG: hypothetical protein U1F27_01395 [Turneriella sp.]